MGFRACLTTASTERLDRENRYRNALGPRLRWHEPPTTKRPMTAGAAEAEGPAYEDFGQDPSSCQTLEREIMDKVWSKLRFVLIAMLLVPAPSCRSVPSSDAAPLMPQTVKFEDSTINLHSIGRLTHQFSIGPPEYPTISECYTHRTQTMEQVLCWSQIEPGFEPNLAGAFTGIIDAYVGENLFGPSAYIASPRNVSGFQAIEFEAYLKEPLQVTTIRSLCLRDLRERVARDVHLRNRQPDG